MFKIQLKAARVNANLDLNAMSKAIKTSKNTIIDWEKKRKPIPEKKYLQYCDACHIDPKYVTAWIVQERRV